jgi:Fur family zinc uptake transcriptional regulator
MKKSALEQIKLLQMAQYMSKERGHRWTEMRQAVFACLLSQLKPITAYQIIAQISEKQKKNIKPASVYRSLDALCELGLVVKIESLNGFIVCGYPQRHHEHVFFICRTCGSADEFADQAINNRLNADASHQGFKIEQKFLELQGECRNCQI